MTPPAGTMRHHHLGLVKLLADVVPPRAVAADRAWSEHVVAPGILIRRLTNAAGEQVYRVSVNGALVMRLTDRKDARPDDYSLAGYWIAVLAVVAAPWRLAAGDMPMPTLPPSRRRHARPSCRGARASNPRPETGAQGLARVLAQLAASLGSSNRRDLDTITLEIERLELQVKLVRLAAEVVVLAHRGGNLRLSASITRRDPSGPIRMTNCVGARWAAAPLAEYKQYSALIDANDLYEFCRLRH